MAFFRKKAPETTTHPITDFWAWWSAEGHTLSPHRESAATDELSRRVSAIHPDLTWHFGPGVDAEHRLTVSAGGIGEVRPAAERWLRAAPTAGPTWEFRSSQEPDPTSLSFQLEIAGHAVDLTQMVFELDVDEGASRAHVGVFHPAYPAMNEDVRQQVMFLVLDWLLGEDDVTKWLGAVEPLETAPAEAVDAMTVRDAVASIAASADPDQWAGGQWEEEDGALGLAIYRPALRWLDHPTMDRHHELTVAYPAQPSGLPADDDALGALHALEESLLATMGQRAVLVGHESIRGHRVFHVYTDGEDANVADQLTQWARSQGVEESSESDPAWRNVRHFTG